MQFTPNPTLTYTDINSCSVGSGGCANDCSDVTSGNCQCPAGYIVSSDRQKCLGESRTLFISLVMVHPNRGEVTERSFYCRNNQRYFEVGICVISQMQ